MHLPFFKNGRSVPIESLTPNLDIQQAINPPAGPAPARPPRPPFALYEAEGVKGLERNKVGEERGTHTRSISCPLSAIPSKTRPRSSSTPHESPQKRRPIALTLHSSNLIPSARTRKEDKSHSSFENIPLPWALVPLSALTLSSVNTYASSPLPPSPLILKPDALSTCNAESLRLTTELARLKAKYAKLLSQRDHLLSELRKPGAEVLRLARDLEKQVRRCDRVARQMYVCNDQIRQMEAQLVEHRVGAWSLRREPCSPVGETSSQHDHLDPDVIFIYPPSQSQSTPVPPSPYHSRSTSVPFSPVDIGAKAPKRTAPLRLATKETRCKSWNETGPVPVKEQRESQWVTPQAMLLSLATANIWTGHAC